jgi:septal ring-binding cell division protein DamX
VLLIVGIGSALKAPSTNSTEQTASAEKSINLSGNDASNQANGAQPAPGATSAEQTAGNTTRRRMFLCRPFLLPRLRVRHLLRQKASSV